MNKDSIGKNKPGGSVSQQIDRALASGEQFGICREKTNQDGSGKDTVPA